MIPCDNVMLRRAIIALGLALALAPVGQSTAADAPSSGRTYRVGFLGAETASYDQPRLDTLRTGLRDLGYVAGTNLVVEVRFAGGDYSRLPDLASRLVARNVDVLVTTGVKATLGARRATATTPIVSMNMGDAIASGLAKSCSQPGGNVPGVAALSPEVMVKRLELLKVANPRIARVAVLVNPENPNFDWYLRDLRTHASPMKVAVEPVAVPGPDALERAFTAMAHHKVDAVIVHNDTMFVSQGKAIADLVARHRFAAVGWPALANDGILVGYNASSAEYWSYLPVYVDEILKGAKPGDLPIRQPTKFELVVNLNAARALGLAIPQSLVVRADPVIR